MLVSLKFDFLAEIKYKIKFQTSLFFMNVLTFCNVKSWYVKCYLLYVIHC